MQENRTHLNKPRQPVSSRGREDTVLSLEVWLPFRLFTISERVADLLNDYYAPKYGLSRAGWRTLAIVANRAGASAKEICLAGGLDQFAVSRAIATLVERGYAQRELGKSDRRYASIALTAEGWNVFQDISVVCRAMDAELTQQIADEEFALLDDILRRLDNASAGMLARGISGLEGIGEVEQPRQ
jgi:DNA-binding MarR family transcriptional regulator